MKFNILIAITFLFLTSSCEGQKKASTPPILKEKTIVKNELKKRPPSPKIKTKRELLISEKGAKPFVITETDYDLNGNIVLVKEFDFYGSGKQDGSTKNEFSEQGIIKSSVLDSDGQITTYTFEYNSNNQKIKETWKRKNGLGEVTEFSYDEKGNPLEEKHLTLEGQHDFSRVYEYEYNSKGNITSEKKWEKYTDGSTDLLQYHTTYQYHEGHLLKKTQLTEQGKPISIAAFQYDANGLKTEEFEGSSSGFYKNTFTYNEYGEMIESKTFRVMEDESEIMDVHSTNTYDDSGKPTGYIYLKGSADFYGTTFEYDFYTH